MATKVSLRWEASFQGRTRRDRGGCTYDAYLPDPLSSRTFSLAGSVAAAVAEAELAIRDLNRTSQSLVDAEAMARLLLRAEAVASSRIEGLAVGGRWLLRAEEARRVVGEPQDVTAEEILGNIRALAWGIDRAIEAETFRVEDILEIHRRLLAATRLAARGGLVRTEQNWIGGSSFNPCSAAFVPPPPEAVPELLQDLTEFCNTESLPALVQAAIAHAQFETIHPFADGNGRTGRALIHVVLRRRGLAPRVVPPVSLVLATWSKDYLAGLMSTRYVGPTTSSEAEEGLNGWISLIANAALRSVADATMYEERVRALQAAWRQRAGAPRSDSATARLITALAGTPVITVRTASELTGRSYQAANAAIARLSRADILRPIRRGRRNRAFEAHEVVDEFNNLERQLASPGGDTLSSPPNRPVPRRR